MLSISGCCLICNLQYLGLGVSNVKPTVTSAQKTVKKEAIISAQETEETDDSEDDDLPF